MSRWRVVGAAALTAAVIAAGTIGVNAADEGPGRAVEKQRRFELMRGPGGGHLGVTLEDGRFLRVAPCIPDDWPGFRVDWRIPGVGSTWEITVANPERRAARVVAATVDGAPAPVAEGIARISLPRDGGLHQLAVVLGA